VVIVVAATLAFAVAVAYMPGRAASRTRIRVLERG
jgi:hypothetical protein